MSFEQWHGQAWNDHAEDAGAVAQRLPEALSLVGSAAQIAQLANLTHHLYGEHLGDVEGGIAFLSRVREASAFDPASDSAQAVARCEASLRLTSPGGTMADGLSASDRIRVRAMAAANLAARDTARALALFEAALAEAAASGLGNTDPMNRALAVTGNNLACTLEEKTDRSQKERELMVIAAQATRDYWEHAGGWLEVERGEYRLSMTWIQAGDLPRARRHARLCRDIVEANGSVPLEHFFAWEAIGTVERLDGQPIAHAHALSMARAAFDALDAGDKGWVEPSLSKLAG